MFMQPAGRHLSIVAAFLIMCSCDWLPTGQSGKMTASVLLDGADRPLVQGDADSSNEAVPTTEMQLEVGAGVALHASAVGGVPPYEFEWSAPGWAGSSAPNPTVTPTATTTYKLQVTDSGDPPSVATISIRVVVNGASSVAVPTFDPPGGVFTGPVDVAISTATPGATIRYTTDGTLPTRFWGAVYSEPVHLTTTTIVKAIAYQAGLDDSAVNSATFTIPSEDKVAAPTFAPACGTFVNSGIVAISTTTPEATLRYTIDGSTPTRTSGIVYTGPFTLDASTTVKAIAYKSGLGDSDVAIADFTEMPGLTGNWSALGGGMDVPAVSSLTVYNGQLIAGGGFDKAGGTTAEGIAAWDGTRWSALGGGVENGGVLTMAVYNGELVAAGTFTTAGGAAANHIASWNGTRWADLGGGMDSSIWTLTVYNGELIAAGFFITAGGTSAIRIASWNGSRWAELGTGMDHTIFALTVHNGRLIAGGEFDTAGGVSVRNIAAWDGAGWSPLGSGLGSVYALADFNGQLVAGTMLGQIMQWDGTSWSARCGETDSAITAFTVYQDHLVVGGQFTVAGGASANQIAAWDGTTWYPLGSGTDGTVDALTLYNGQLIAGGLFRTAGGKTAKGIAAWVSQ